MTSETEPSDTPSMESASLSTTASQSSSDPVTGGASFAYSLPVRSATTPSGPSVPAHHSATGPSSPLFGRGIFRSRSRSPAHINTRSLQTHGRGHSDTSPIPPLTSPTWPGRHHSPPSSAVSPTSPDRRKTASPPLRKNSSSDHRRLSGTVNHCGRHSNDWLFGGFSLRESVGKLWRESPTPDEKGG